MIGESTTKSWSDVIQNFFPSEYYLIVDGLKGCPLTAMYKGDGQTSPVLSGKQNASQEGEWENSATSGLTTNKEVIN